MTSIKNSKLEDLKVKVFYSFLLLAVYRFAAQVPVAGINAGAIASFFKESGGGIFDLVNTFSGGAFKRFSVLALGIMPYITTSIIFSLLGEIVPQIQEMQEDSEGNKKIQKWTRYASVVLCCIQGYGMAVVFEGFKTSTGMHVVSNPGMIFRITSMITLAGGTMFLLWLGERLTEYGLENGVSLIIFTGIAVELPAEIMQRLTLVRSGEMSYVAFFSILAFALFLLYFVAFIESAFRNINIQYARRVVGGKSFGGSQKLPLRLDTGGVMPPILASSLLAAPATLLNFVPKTSVFRVYFESLHQSLVPGGLLFNLLFAGLIFYMSYFYAPIQFKTKKVSEMLQKNNAYVPGIMPGAKTKDYLDFVLERVTFIGALFLISVCVVPSVVTKSHSRFEGTSLLIMVSVAMRVMMNIQVMMHSKDYDDSFKSRGKYRGANRRF